MCEYVYLSVHMYGREGRRTLCMYVYSAICSLTHIGTYDKQQIIYKPSHEYIRAAVCDISSRLLAALLFP